MKTYIALLRGINVSGQKKIKMADLKIKVESLGFTSVTTYIQSGNIVFQSTTADLDLLATMIKKEIKQYFGFDVPVLVITSEILQSIHNDNPFLEKIEKEEIEAKKMYFTLLSQKPNPENVALLASTSYGEEEFVITKNCVYFYAVNGYGRTKLNNNFFEKKLQCNATTRNLRTIRKLMELSDLL